EARITSLTGLGNGKSRVARVMAIEDGVRQPEREARCFACTKAWRLAGYEDVNEAERLGRGPARRWAGGWPLRRRGFKPVRGRSFPAYEGRIRQLPSRGRTAARNSSQDANSRASKPSHSSRSRSESRAPSSSSVMKIFDFLP